MSLWQPQMSASQATFAEPRAIPSHLFLRGGAAAWVVPPPHILPFLPAPWDGTCLQRPAAVAHSLPACSFLVWLAAPALCLSLCLFA